MKLYLHLCFVFLFLMSAFQTSAQTIVKIPQIDLIAYDSRGNYIFYQKQEENAYNRIHLELTNSFFQEKYNLASATSIEIDKDNPSTLEKIKENYQVILKSELKKQSLSDFKSYLSQNTWQVMSKRNDKESPVIFKTINPSLLSLAELRYGYARSGGFGSTYEESPDDDVKKWRPYGVKFLNIVYLEIDPNTYVALLNDSNNDKGIFIPLKNNEVALNNVFESITTKKLNPSDSLARIPEKLILDYFNAMNFFQPKKGDDGKSFLVNSFGDPVLKQSFDSINYNRYFIVGKEAETYTIYKTNLEKVKFDSIKSAYLYRSGLEVLEKNGAHYYNYKLEKIEQFPRAITLYCGTVPFKNYKLVAKENNKNPHRLILEEGHFGSSALESLFYLKGLSKNQKVTFLDNSISENTNSNSGFSFNNNMLRNILKVQEDGKFGLVSYNLEKAKLHKPKPEYNVFANGDSIEIPSLRIKEGSIKVKEVLSMRFDSIVFKAKEQQVYLYNEGKVGIYPQQEEAVYDSIQQQTNSFYYFLKNEIKGYLDRKKFIEYLD